MKRERLLRFLAVAITLTSVFSLAGCSLKAESSSTDSSSTVTDDKDALFADLLAGSSASDNLSPGFTLDGHFDKQTVSTVSALDFDSWITLGVANQFSYSVELLNMWMYYGDDASIRFQPSEIVDGITLNLHSAQSEGNTAMTVLDAVLFFAKPSQNDRYYDILGIKNPSVEDNVTDSSPTS